MSIVSSAFPAPAVAGSSAGFKRNSQEFAAILDKGGTPAVASLSRPVGPLSPEQQSQEVFSFEALGVFGRYGDHGFEGRPQQQEVATTGLSAVPRSKDAPLDGEVVDDGLPGHAAVVAAAPDTVAGLEMQGLSKLAAKMNEPAGTVPRSPVLQDLPAVAGNIARRGEWRQSSEPTTVEEALLSKRWPCKNRVRLSRDESASSEDAGSVTVAGDDAAISIVVRNVDGSISSESLRHVVSNVVAEFGARASEILINGENQNFSTFIGGNDGRRAR